MAPSRARSSRAAPANRSAPAARVQSVAVVSLAAVSAGIAAPVYDPCPPEGTLTG